MTVTKVNTLNVKSKPKRMRGAAGRTRTWKKAMVTLKEGDTIVVSEAPTAATKPSSVGMRLF